jgi:hypothetical protein
VQSSSPQAPDDLVAEAPAIERPAVAETGRAREAQRVDLYAPFGGKESSYGPRQQGTAALEFYTSVRTITFAPHDGRWTTT